MIDISKLTQKDIGKWVRYLRCDGKTELGKIKSWNEEFIFVVYKCFDEWQDFDKYTGVATSPGDLVFASDYDNVPYLSKADILYKGRDYESSVKEVNEDES